MGDDMIAKTSKSMQVAMFVGRDDWCNVAPSRLLARQLLRAYMPIIWLSQNPPNGYLILPRKQ